MPRYIERVQVDPLGTREQADLPESLPYNLHPRDFFRMVEDLQELLVDLNTMLHPKGYQRMEEVLDRAGFSGLISKTAATRLAKASRTLVVNQYHNGYPDLLIDGQYAQNAVQRGTGGLEVKASRTTRSWQAHGPREGWFCVVQFELDEREEVAMVDREPTRIRAVMAAELISTDWSWQPAKEGRIRSGTASIKASGVAKCRDGWVWVDPDYRTKHEELLAKAWADAFSSQAADLVEDWLRRAGQPATVADIAADLAAGHHLDTAVAQRRVGSALQKLAKNGRAQRPRRGQYVLANTALTSPAAPPVEEQLSMDDEAVEEDDS